MIESKHSFAPKLVLWAHVYFGFATGLIYLSRIDVAGAVWPYRGGTGAFFIVVPVLIPYFASGFYSLRVMTDVRWRAVLFVLVLFVGASLVGLAVTGFFGRVEPPALVLILGAQWCLYVWTAELLLHVV